MSNSELAPADLEGIRRTLDDYHRFHDERRSEEWVALFVPEARYVVHDQEYLGHEGLWRFLVERRSGAGKHINGVPLVTRLADGLCSAEVDYVGYRRAEGMIVVGGTGRYYDRLRRDDDGRWRFVERRIAGALRSDRDIVEPRTAEVTTGRPVGGRA
ncbi:nuclear transport factor 2 family protein [Amycolatopsis echigonensis]|uniref:Nuclear transport factor 2 family protein n=1 Tax=Amycolatopsis echigonensis TaxID=2576905 RepID=A0A8E1W7M1_9PSEU|nr:nuclear transport factor 2 family protein [Amycolatopsis echigonensis]MBB2505137.1 nuclear transport factor 2 family protein [Amycolatopsis echigonensis]